MYWISAGKVSFALNLYISVKSSKQHFIDLVKTRSSHCNDPNTLTIDNDGCEAMCTFLPWNNYGCVDTQHRNAWLYCRNGSSVYDTSNGACDKRRGGKSKINLFDLFFVPHVHEDTNTTCRKTVTLILILKFNILKP